MSQKTTRVIPSSQLHSGSRPHTRNPYRITPIAYQELKESELPPPAAVVSLDAYDVKIIQEYRAAKEAWDKARSAADAQAKISDSLKIWQSEDMAAVEQAHQALQKAEMSMALIFDYMAKRAGI